MGIRHNYAFLRNYKLPPGLAIENDEQELFALNYNASFYRLLRKSKLDLNSKWGQTLALHYKHTPFGGTENGTQYSAESNLYFPGLFRHQSLHLRGSYQNESYENFPFFQVRSVYTRGYSYQSFDQFVNLSVNYKLPLIYMDLHMGPVLNVQRIYANLFYDQGIGMDKGQPDNTFYSVGAEVSFNINLFRLLPLIDIGFRYSYLPETNQSVTELIFGGIIF